MYPNKCHNFAEGKRRFQYGGRKGSLYKSYHETFLLLQLNVIPNEQFAGETLQDTPIISRTVSEEEHSSCDFPTVMEATVSITISSINIEDLNHFNEVNL